MLEFPLRTLIILTLMEPQLHLMIKLNLLLFLPFLEVCQTTTSGPSDFPHILDEQGLLFVGGRAAGFWNGIASSLAAAMLEEDGLGLLTRL